MSSFPFFNLSNGHNLFQSSVESNLQSKENKKKQKTKNKKKKKKICLGFKFFFCFLIVEADVSSRTRDPFFIQQ